jgi:hypothetical protein
MHASIGDSVGASFDLFHQAQGPLREAEGPLRPANRIVVK